MTRACKDCSHFCETEGPNTVNECRYYPPKTFHYKGEYKSIYPHVDPEGWCGKFRKKDRSGNVMDFFTEDSFKCPRCGNAIRRSQISIHAVHSIEEPWNTGFEFCGGCPNCDRKRRAIRQIEIDKERKENEKN